jgi:hypothetical protein
MMNKVQQQNATLSWHALKGTLSTCSTSQKEHQCGDCDLGTPKQAAHDPQHKRRARCLAQANCTGRKAKIDQTQSPEKQNNSTQPDVSRQLSHT